MSQSEKKLAKLQRKELKKNAKHVDTHIEDMSSASILDLDGEYLRNAREQQLVANMSAPMVANPVRPSEYVLIFEGYVYGNNQISACIPVRLWWIRVVPFWDAVFLTSKIRADRQQGKLHAALSYTLGLRTSHHSHC